MMLKIRSLLVTTLAVAACLACTKEKADDKGQAASASPSASVAAIPSAKPVEKPWFFGEWRASLEVARYQVEQTKQEGKVAAWAADTGDKATGKGELVLEIDEEGKVTGSASGALGKLNASGLVDGEELRVQLHAAEALPPPEMFNGVLLGQKEKDGFSGELKASSGDSLTVRKAAVTLTKQANAEAGAKGK